MLFNLVDCFGPVALDDLHHRASLARWIPVAGVHNAKYGRAARAHQAVSSSSGAPSKHCANSLTSLTHRGGRITPTDRPAWRWTRSPRARVSAAAEPGGSFCAIQISRFTA